jgi:hypothetical protein
MFVPGKTNGIGRTYDHRFQSRYQLRSICLELALVGEFRWKAAVDACDAKKLLGWHGRGQQARIWPLRHALQDLEALGVIEHPRTGLYRLAGKGKSERDGKNAARSVKQDSIS